jgi:hypothetical protein
MVVFMRLGVALLQRLWFGVEPNPLSQQLAQTMQFLLF